MKQFYSALLLVSSSLFVACPLIPGSGDPVCGDTTIDDGEQCDDGNTTDGDGCDANCQEESAAPVCGDGQVDPGEQCDDGNQDNTDECTTSCVVAGCNDGIDQPGEICLLPIGNFGTNNQISSIAKGDFDQDGDVDLVVTNPTANRLVVLENEEGDFTFQNQINDVGQQPQSVSVADFDGDSKEDLVVALEGATILGPNEPQLGIHLGRGQNLFDEEIVDGVPVRYTTCPNPDKVTTGDFSIFTTPQGGKDLLVSCQTDGVIRVQTRFGQGLDINFSSEATISPSDLGFVRDSAMGDFRGDGFQDVFAYFIDPSVLFIFDNFGTDKNGNSSFLEQRIPLDVTLSAMRFADINGDGLLDAVGVRPAPSEIVVLRAETTVSFSQASFPALGDARVLELADMDGDQQIDVVVGTSSGEVLIMKNLGNGQFAEFTRMPAAASVEAITIAELNGDNIPDVAAAQLNGDVTVFLSNP